MIIVEDILNQTNEYNRYIASEYGRSLFFDIETTGLSAFTGSIYLIGCIYEENHRLILKQFMAESFSEELPVLKAFFELAKGFDTLVHYNGDTFDIRFLNTAAEQYSLPSPLSDLKSLDILKKVRKHKSLLNLSDCRLKTIERFLGIFREDPYTGGELIEVYQQYSRNRDDKLKDMLLLHNREDLEGMLKILPILLYDDVISHPEDYLQIREQYLNRSGTFLYIHTEFRESLESSGLHFPRDISREIPKMIDLSFENRELIFRIPVRIGEMKYFYPDYKNYYYLPKEDSVVHKKVGQYVDPGYREQAKKENCYTKASGIFVPKISKKQLGFGDCYEEKDLYTLLNDNNVFSYLCQVLTDI